MKHILLSLFLMLIYNCVSAQESSKTPMSLEIRGNDIECSKLLKVSSEIISAFSSDEKINLIRAKLSIEDDSIIFPLNTDSKEQSKYLGVFTVENFDGEELLTARIIEISSWLIVSSNDMMWSAGNIETSLKEWLKQLEFN